MPIDKEVYKKILGEIINNTRKACIDLSLTVEPVSIYNSKMGGYPYFPKGMEYPKDENEDPMILFVQLNFEELPELENYPKEGILQIFICGTDDTMGANPDDVKEQTNYKIIYHPTIEKDESKLQKLPKKIKTMIDKEFDEDGDIQLMFSGVFKINGKISENVGCLRDVTQSKLIDKLATKYGVETSDIEDSLIEDPSFSKDGMRIGGNPSYIDLDPRSEETKKYDTLLLQIDSQMYSKDEPHHNNTEDEYKTCFGDGGIVHFFIEKEKLLKKDFSEVLFCFDQC
ncbi:hypothetical protein, conserved [Entamoeba dispar SAW760]|uniref:DUF1963 domain-containing protein n=1 Tax=Entamoeba dispar (strain ATCC PRA-260 / SAW760) TaxID=370354 RepID=B0EN38_ENTDS|nr:uncharacterized protein EDI_035210 [Entamoeba dispar SAW760]EDR24063.1 hypothetical protein, conserved [Entamoeba dispar SAW760]|eukprot:EDR24063.1 hypothetical protein, conserved [Entamoeba dispar SAW760]